MTPAGYDPRREGVLHGLQHRHAIRANIAAYRRAAGAAGWECDQLERAAGDLYRSLPREQQVELDAIGAAAGVAEIAHRSFVLTAGAVAPDECTVVAAVGAASASGATILLKNSDKIGADELVGEGYQQFKEINVVVKLTTDQGVTMLGVAAAGTTNLKMGVNDAGLAVASNIARTAELRARKRSLDDLRALDRGLLLRQALGFSSAADAATWSMDAITEAPMATPGILHFAEARQMYIVEGSYDRIALERVQDRVVARANGFVLLDELNDGEDDSSPARRSRALQMVGARAGVATVEDLRRVSIDHHNGPGVRSICRHSDDHIDETTLSSMLMAFDPDDPTRGTAEFALGKPCWAWQSSESAIAIEVGSNGDVPAAFSNGSAWRRGYREDPRDKAPGE